MQRTIKDRGTTFVRSNTSALGEDNGIHRPKLGNSKA
jgi:hypothetical protein